MMLAASGLTSMGFSLDEVVGLLELNGGRAYEQTEMLTEHKLLDVRKRLCELRKLERELLRLVASCGETRACACCPTLELLEHAETEALPRSQAKQVTSNCVVEPCVE